MCQAIRVCGARCVHIRAARHRHKHFSVQQLFFFFHRLFLLRGTAAIAVRRRIIYRSGNFSKWTVWAGGRLLAHVRSYNILAQQLNYSLQSTFIMCYENLHNYKKMNIMRFFNIIKFGVSVCVFAEATLLSVAVAVCWMSQKFNIHFGFLYSPCFFSANFCPLSFACALSLWVLGERTRQSFPEC